MCTKNHENTGQAVSVQTERMTLFCLTDRLKVVLSFFSVFLFCLFIFVCCIKLKFFYCLVLVQFQLKISTRDINHDEGDINCLK